MEEKKKTITPESFKTLGAEARAICFANIEQAFARGQEVAKIMGVADNEDLQGMFAYGYVGGLIESQSDETFRTGMICALMECMERSCSDLPDDMLTDEEKAALERLIAEKE